MEINIVGLALIGMLITLIVELFNNSKRSRRNESDLSDLADSMHKEHIKIREAMTRICTHEKYEYSYWEYHDLTYYKTCIACGHCEPATKEEVEAYEEAILKAQRGSKEK